LALKGEVGRRGNDRLLGGFGRDRLDGAKGPMCASGDPVRTLLTLANSCSDAVSFLAPRRWFPGFRRRIHLYGRPAWWLRILGWLAFGVAPALIDIRRAPIGLIVFEVGFQILSWWQYHRQLWSAVSGETAFLASRGVEIVTVPTGS
jgi:hypothetical protein